MKQILITNKGNKSLEVAMPTSGDNELLVAVYSSVISTGTETMDMRKNDLTFSEKLMEKKLLWDKVNRSIKKDGLASTLAAIKNKLSPSEQSYIFKSMGYSNAGVVVGKGKLVNNFSIGDRVACAGSGIASHAEFAAIPVNLAVKISDSLSFEAAGFTTIGAIAMQGIRRANVSFGETIMITGLGLLGLIAVQIAKAWGLVVIGVDLNDERLILAKEFGADFCFNAADINLLNEIKSITHNNGVDAAIIYAATKSSEPANIALQACRRKGRVVVVGAIGMNIERQSMYAKELDFVMSTSYGPGRYDSVYEMKGIDYPIGYVRWTENRNMMEFVRLLTEQKVNVEKLISHTFSIDEVEEAYKVLIDNPTENIASVFTYSHDAEEDFTSRLEIKARSVTRNKIGVGIIGAGGFVQQNHLANILNMPDDFELIAIANKTPESAKSVGEKYRPHYVTTDYQQLLNDDNIDLIVIGTRHHLHAVQVCDAIKAGKHVLVEKPLAMSFDELQNIEEAIQSHPDVHVSVGFNRRYSPFIIKTKEVIQQNNAPVVINYRVNAGYLPAELWVQNLEEGGGRIVGEACHFIDLIAHLANSSIKNLQSVSIPLDSKNIQAEDNLIVTISFKDGSIGVLTYAAIGGKDLGKERIEIFSKGISIVIDDFVSMEFYNYPEKSIQLKEADKGHKNLIRELAKLLRNKDSIIVPFGRDIDMTRYTLQVVDQIHQS